jgi:hypothetical protein
MSLLKKPNRLEEWARSLPLSEIIADAFPAKPGQDPLRVASELSDFEVSVVCSVFCYGFKKKLMKSLKSLKNAFEVTDNRDVTDGGSKFNVLPLSCGDISAFHDGVEARIGFFL